MRQQFSFWRLPEVDDTEVVPPDAGNKVFSWIFDHFEDEDEDESD